MSSLVTVVLVNYNGYDILIPCIESILKQNYNRINIIVLDNGSKDGSMQLIEENYPQVRTVYLGDNLGWGIGNNIGMKMAFEDGADYALLLNTDTELEENLVSTLLKYADENTVTIPRIYRDDPKEGRCLWYAGGKIDFETACTEQVLYEYNEKNKEDKKPRNVDFATGCCMLVPKCAWDKVGGFDEAYFLYYEDTDYCVRLKEAGFNILYVPEVGMWHKVGASSGAEVSDVSQYYTVRNRLYFADKFADKMKVSTMDIMKLILSQRTFFDTVYDKTFEKVVMAGIYDYVRGEFGKEKNIFHDSYKVLSGFYGVEKNDTDYWQWCNSEYAEIEITNFSSKRKVFDFTAGLSLPELEGVPKYRMLQIYIGEELYDTVKIPKRQVAIQGFIEPDSKLKIGFKILNAEKNDNPFLRDRILYYSIENAKVEMYENRDYVCGHGFYGKLENKDPETMWVGDSEAHLIINNRFKKECDVLLSYRMVPPPYSNNAEAWVGVNQGSLDKITAGMQEMVVKLLPGANRIDFHIDTETDGRSGLNPRKIFLGLKDINLSYIGRKRVRYNPKSKDELKKIIDCYDSVSFDIWDTLVMRCVWEPEDIYKIVERKADYQGIRVKDFARVRREATYLIKKSNPKLEDYYSVIQDQFSLRKTEVNRLMKLEIDIEKSLLVPRRDMIDIFNYAVESGKKVSLVSDMYISEEITRTIISDIGIDDTVPVFVSCDYDALKTDNLFKIYKDSTDGVRYLHIGDNEKADVRSALSHGIDAAYIRSGRDIMKRTKLLSIISSAVTENDFYMVGLLCQVLCNSPFADRNEDGKFIVNSNTEYGWLYVAPIVTEFMCWLSDELQKEPVDGVLFAARDGYLLNELYRVMKSGNRSFNLPDYYYFLTSRAQATLCGISDVKDAEEILKVPYAGTEEEKLQHRFLFEKEQLGGNILDNIISNSAKQRNIYLEYMRKLGIKDDGSYVLYDFVSSGTSQKWLQKFVPFGIKGKYFCKSKIEWIDQSDIDSLYVNDGINVSDSYLYKSYKNLEKIMTSDKPSLWYFDEDGQPVYEKEHRTPGQIRNLKEIHLGIRKYFAQFMKMWNPSEAISQIIPEQMLMLLESDIIEKKCAGMSGIELRDDWVNDNAAETLDDSDIEAFKAIMEGKADNPASLLKESDSFTIFYNFSEMRKSLLNWYPFDRESNLLEIGGSFGAMTGLFLEKCREVTVFEFSEKKAQAIRKRYNKSAGLSVVSGKKPSAVLNKKYDYIVVTADCCRNCKNPIESWNEIVREAAGLLAKNGTLLLAIDNAEGTKYQCGYPLPGKNSINENGDEPVTTRNRLLMQAKKLGLNYKFYYPLPDYRLAQEIYSDDCLPDGNLRDRVMNYYVAGRCLNTNESEIYGKVKQYDALPEVCNSFLLECRFDDTHTDIQYVSLTTDRGEKNGFATVVKEKNVEKTALYEAGRMGLLRSCDNIHLLSDRGVPVVKHELIDDKLIMPRIRHEKLVNVLRDIAACDRESFIKELDKCRDYILMSSDSKKVKGKVILQHGYIDLIPLNCFYDNGEYMYFDQEFEVSDCPLDYIMFRLLHYTYASCPDIEEYVPIEDMKDRYGIKDEWEKYSAIEDKFIFENRQHDINHMFFKWVENGNTRDPYFEDDNWRITLLSGFDNVEEDEVNRWSWATMRQALLLVTNKSGEEKNCNLQFEMSHATDEDSLVVIEGMDKQKWTVGITDKSFLTFPVAANSSYWIRFTYNGTMKADKARKLAFQILNLKISNDENVFGWLKEIPDRDPYLVQDDCEVRLLAGFDNLEIGDGNRWSWCVNKESRIAILNRTGHKVTKCIKYVLESSPDGTSRNIRIDDSNGGYRICSTPCVCNVKVEIEAYGSYWVHYAIEGEEETVPRGGERKLLFQLRNLHFMDETAFDWLCEMPDRGAYLEDDDCEVKLLKGFDDLEADETNRWSWAVEPETQMVVSNKSSSTISKCISFVLESSAAGDIQDVYMEDSAGEKRHVKTPDQVRIMVELHAQETYWLKFYLKQYEYNGPQAGRQMLFQLRNPHFEE